MSRITRILDQGTTTNPGPEIRWLGPIALALGAIITAGCIGNVASTGTAAEAAPDAAVQDSDRGQDQDRGARADLPPAEALMRRLKTGVESGRITQEQMDQIMRVYKRFAMGVESGRMSSEEANTMFGERVRKMLSGDEAGKAERAPEADEKARANRMGAMMIELGKALESGEITPEQALERVMSVAKRMQMAGGEKTPAEQRANRARYAEAEKQMAAKVEKGEITREQMEQRLGEMKRIMVGESDSKKMTRADYAEAEKKMAAMVAKGEITEEQMNQRLNRMRLMIGKEMKGVDADKSAYMERIGERLKMAVESGDMTREEAGEKYSEMEKAYDARSSSKDAGESRSITRQDYASAQAKMQGMVDKGEITEDQMNERLAVMRRMIVDTRKKDEDKGDDGGKRE
jgi:hypothetical protein